jgi:hypothetical protein
MPTSTEAANQYVPRQIRHFIPEESHLSGNYVSGDTDLRGRYPNFFRAFDNIVFCSSKDFEH